MDLEFKRSQRKYNFYVDKLDRVLNKVAGYRQKIRCNSYDEEKNLRNIDTLVESLRNSKPVSIDKPISSDFLHSLQLLNKSCGVHHKNLEEKKNDHDEHQHLCHKVIPRLEKYIIRYACLLGISIPRSVTNIRINDIDNGRFELYSDLKLGEDVRIDNITDSEDDINNNEN